MRLFWVNLLVLALVLGAACTNEANDEKPTPTVLPGHHQNLDEYRWEVRLVDNSSYQQSFFTDTEPKWLVPSCPPVLRIENFRRVTKEKYSLLEPEFGASFDLLPDKDQRLEVIKK